MIEALPAEAYKNVTEMQDDRSLGNGMTKYWQDVLGNFDSDLGFYNDGHSVTYSGDLSLAQRDGVTKMVEYILEERKG